MLMKNELITGGYTLLLNRQQRAHSPQLAAGLASEYKNYRIPYREDSLQLAAGYSSIITGPVVLIVICQAGEFITDYHRLLNTHTRIMKK
jgi:hypothetical protein